MALKQCGFVVGERLQFVTHSLHAADAEKLEEGGRKSAAMLSAEEDVIR